MFDFVEIQIFYIMKQSIVLLFSCLAFFACTKQEGEGGLNKVSGFVYVQELDEQLQAFGTPYPAQDEDVYIQYGKDAKKVDDKTATSFDGYFEFQYLTPGDYTLFSYSDDTSDVYADVEIPVSRLFSFEGKKDEVNVDTILVFKIVSKDYDDGHADITGFVGEKVYSSGTSILLDSVAAQNRDVFLAYKNGMGILDRVRSAYDGSYIFQNIMPGEYVVYVLSEQLFYADYKVISADFVINSETDNIQLDTLVISNY